VRKTLAASGADPSSQLPPLFMTARIASTASRTVTASKTLMTYRRFRRSGGGFLWCCKGSSQEVALCTAKACPSWSFRFGHKPADGIITEQGNTLLHPLEWRMTAAEFHAKWHSPLKAIKRKCLDCSGASKSGVRNCAFNDCALHAFRQGKNPHRAYSPEERARLAAQLAHVKVPDVLIENLVSIGDQSDRRRRYAVRRYDTKSLSLPIRPQSCVCSNEPASAAAIKRLAEYFHMTAKPNPQPVEEAAAPPPPDPFDRANLRLDQSFIESAGVKKLLTTVPVRKPNPQDFVRVHPAPEYRETLAIIELKDDREIYLLLPPIARELPGEFKTAVLHTVINRQGVLHLWPVMLPTPDGRINEWHRSAAEAAELAMRRWIRIKANMGLGAYEIFEAASTISEPEWPETPFSELLRIAFRVRLVDRLDHAVIKRLRGA
jgi:hypothetical protein